jgi:putative ABC transport system substrate-binding protein
MIRGPLRRRFLASAVLLFSVLFCGAAGALATEHRVAFILSTSPIAEMGGRDPVHPGLRAFIDELRVLGYAEGRNLVLERRTAEGKTDRYPAIVSELVALKTEVIAMAGNNSHYLAAKRATGAIPIVMVASSQPEKVGLVASLARPGGNVTGLTVEGGPQIEAKRLQILKQAMPTARRVDYLGTKQSWQSAYAQAARGAAEALGVELLHVEHTPTDYAAAFASMERDRPDAVFASFTAETFAQRAAIVAFLRKSGLPGIFPYREMAEAGGLMSYGVNALSLFRRAAHYVDKILQGANPADLPVEQPSTYDLVINLKAAKALGLTIPPAMLLQASEVIQ